MMRAHVLLLLSMVACSPSAPAPAQVRPGIEVLLSDSAHLIRGKRLGLLTNQTGVDRRGRRDADLLQAAGYRLTVLFSPEHGFRGVEDRPGLPDTTDAATGLPIYSLYGGTRGYAALEGVDVVLIDLQDIGARYYTYVSTAAGLLRAAARRGLSVVVLDRPNPIGGAATQGAVRDSVGDPERDLVGFLPVPMRHGMTLGELLRMADDLLDLGAALTVVPAAGWHRDQYFDATGLPWVRPSLNMPSLESALHYPGICLFEGTNLSVGRGTGLAFQLVGAPWLDAGAVLARMGAQPGVEIGVADFTPERPSDGKYDGVLLHGLRLRVTDRGTYDPAATAVALLVALHALHSDSLRIRRDAFDRLAAGPALREAILAGRDVTGGWAAALERFRRTRSKYLLY